MCFGNISADASSCLALLFLGFTIVAVIVVISSRHGGCTLPLTSEETSPQHG